MSRICGTLLGGQSLAKQKSATGNVDVISVWSVRSNNSSQNRHRVRIRIEWGKKFANQLEQGINLYKSVCLIIYRRRVRIRLVWQLLQMGDKFVKWRSADG